MHPDDVPDPRLPFEPTGGEAPAPPEGAGAPADDSRWRDLSAFLPHDGLVAYAPDEPDDASTAPAQSPEDVVVRVREVWAEVLGGESPRDIPLDVNFLELGGNSLLLVMLWEELQPIAGGRLKLSELFQHGTVQAQAELLTGRPDEAVPAGRVTQARSRSLLGQRRAAAGGALA